MSPRWSPPCETSSPATNASTPFYGARRWRNTSALWMVRIWRVTCNASMTRWGSPHLAWPIDSTGILIEGSGEPAPLAPPLPALRDSCGRRGKQGQYSRGFRRVVFRRTPGKLQHRLVQLLPGRHHALECRNRLVLLDRRWSDAGVGRASYSHGEHQPRVL